ncbi:MAG TPA: coproporphyrinogen III oxidase [Chitinophagaceae bacterium]|nr:coproporphyrinogen III oxidase [Chitinophagaceae bacterium]
MAGIYIHIPFCKQACHYCNFHFSTSLALQNDFTTALLKEIEWRKTYLDQETIETIYFGGGTPSLLPDSALRDILDAVYHHFRISPNPEITLESNPDDMQPDRLQIWKDIGINRLSIGIQSFFAEDLTWMNRAHDARQAIQAVEQVKKTGIDHFSLDLIYGFPGMTDEKWEKNLRTAISSGAPHISCYALTVEPKTALFKMIRMKKTADVQPEKQVSQFLSGIEILEAAGYEHYEISSFAKPGNRSRHNSSYWQSEKYLGLGPSAHSFDGRSRQWNISNNALYIQSVKTGKLSFESEILQPGDMLNEYIMTSLRTGEGLDLQYVSDQFGKEKRIGLEKNAATYINRNQMESNQGKLVLTKNGKLFADGIAAALFFD